LDALVPAFVAALLAGIGDRPARLAALLGERGRFASVVAGLTLGHALGIAISVAGAWMIAPLLAPNARALLLAVALILAGAGGLWRRTPPAPAGDGFVAAATGSFLTGDATAFLAFAIAVKGSAPVLAGIGALAGTLVLGVSAAAMGREWARLPLSLIARIAGVLLLGTGLVVALGALRLI
jgi:putative Ca2+/H+ antiporter (TMEM165/GDT1 family)